MKKASGWKTKKDKKVSCPPTMKRHFGYWRRTMRSLRERCLGGISDSKRKSTSKKSSHQRGGFKPFRKGSSGGKANMANENQDPYDQAYWGKGKGKKGKTGKSKSNIPMMETRAIHPMTMAKEKVDKRKENPKRSQPSQRRRRNSPPFSRLHHPQSLPMPVGQIKIGIHPGIGVNKAGTHPMRHPAQNKR